MKAPTDNRNLAEYNMIPVSTQGQVTLPKPIRERLGLKTGSPARVNFIMKADGTIVIEPVPTAGSLFGILEAEFKAKGIKPVDSYAVREEIMNERLRELGYSPQDN
ncbi:MAG: AbrB/MazE/SpoVT family DNA-binding domain-containing protein [Bacillota bacterium]